MKLANWKRSLVVGAVCVLAAIVANPVSAAKPPDKEKGGGKPDPGYISVIAEFKLGGTKIYQGITVPDSTIEVFNEYDFDPDDEEAPLGGGHCLPHG